MQIFRYWSHSLIEIRPDMKFKLQIRPDIQRTVTDDRLTIARGNEGIMSPPFHLHTWLGHYKLVPKPCEKGSTLLKLGEKNKNTVPAKYCSDEATPTIRPHSKSANEPNYGERYDPEGTLNKNSLCYLWDCVHYTVNRSMSGRTYTWTAGHT